MTEIINRRSTRGEGEDAFRLEYVIRRNDGTDAFVETFCSRTAEHSVRSDYAATFVADKGESAALWYAERKPQAKRLTLWIDSLNGSVRCEAQ